MSFTDSTGEFENIGKTTSKTDLSINTMDKIYKKKDGKSKNIKFQIKYKNKSTTKKVEIKASKQYKKQLVKKEEAKKRMKLNLH